MAEWVNEYETFAKQKWEPTRLSTDEEKKFRGWLQSTKLFNSVKNDVAIEQRMPVAEIDNNRLTEMLLSSKDYDYRGAWKAGVKEVISPHDGKPHWPSSAGGKMLKSPQHETAWKEFFMRQHKQDPDDLGLSSFEQAKNWSLERQNSGSRKQSRPLLMGK